MSQAPTLNDPVRIAGLDLPNRIVMAPLTRSRAGASGVPGPLNVEYYAQRASAGLIITEATNVGPLSCAFERAPGIWRPDQVEGWTRVTEAVHGKGGRIFMQLWHGGRVGAKGLLDGHEPVSPSGVNDDLDALEVWGQLANGHYVKIKATPSRALSTAEVEAVVEEYRVGASNAKAAGFDGVEIHSANGYLPHQFLSSATNRRTDRYGGSVENRGRFLQEVVDAAISWSGRSGSACACRPTLPTTTPWIRIRHRPTLTRRPCSTRRRSVTCTSAIPSPSPRVGRRSRRSSRTSGRITEAR